MPFETAHEETLLAKKTKALRANPHLPADLIDLACGVYARQLAARAEAVIDGPDPGLASSPEGRSQGLPILARERFPHDRNLTGALLAEFAALLASRGADQAGAAKTVQDALARSEPGLDGAVAALLGGESELFSESARLTPAAPRALSFLVQSSLWPSLAVVAARLMPKWPKEKTWLFGHCPACASPPLIGVLEGKEGQRWLWCSLCGTYYRVRRLPCPYCLEENTDKLPFFLAEGEPGFRLDVCESCGKYIKTVDFREFDRISLPPLDDLESLALDVLAAKRGYKRPTLSFWGF